MWLLVSAALVLLAGLGAVIAGRRPGRVAATALLVVGGTLGLLRPDATASAAECPGPTIVPQAIATASSTTSSTTLVPKSATTTTTIAGMLQSSSTTSIALGDTSTTSTTTPSTSTTSTTSTSSSTSTTTTSTSTTSTTTTSTSTTSTTTTTTQVPDPPSAGDDAIEIVVPWDPGVATVSTNLLANDDLGTPTATFTSFGGNDLGGNVQSYPPGSTQTAGRVQITADGSGGLTVNTPYIDVTITFHYRITNSAGSSDALVTIKIGRAPPPPV